MSNASSASVSDDACRAAIGSFEDQLRGLDAEIGQSRAHLANAEARRAALIDDERRRLRAHFRHDRPQISAQEAQMLAQQPRDHTDQMLALQCVQTVINMFGTLSNYGSAPPTPDAIITISGSVYDFVQLNVRPN